MKIRSVANVAYAQVIENYIHIAMRPISVDQKLDNSWLELPRCQFGYGYNRAIRLEDVRFVCWFNITTQPALLSRTTFRLS